MKGISIYMALIILFNINFRSVCVGGDKDKQNSGHGATLIDGEGSFAHKNKKIVYSIVSASDTRKLIPLIKEIDPTAFVNSIRTEEVMGHF